MIVNNNNNKKNLFTEFKQVSLYGEHIGIKYLQIKTRTP